MTIVVIDDRAVRDLLHKLPSGLRDKAMTMAINKTEDKARTEMKRRIAAIYNLSSSEIGNSLKVIRASVKSQVVAGALYPVSLSGRRRQRAMNVIHFLEKKISLAEAKRRTRSGTLYELFFKFKKAGGSRVISAGPGGAPSKPFLGNNGRTVFRRIENSRSSKIEPVQIIDIPAMFDTKSINKAVVAKAKADLVIETDRAVSRLLSTL